MTREGTELVKTSLIMGLATDISPIPPVQSSVDVEKSNQNCGVFITDVTLTLPGRDPALPLSEIWGGVQPAGEYPGAGFFMRKAEVMTAAA